MKTQIKITILVALLAAGSALKAQDNPKEYLGLPGDNLNLYAVMNTFQESKNLKAFERNLNDPENRINNLDLNGDNLVDYIMVSDNVNENVHYVIMRVAINRRESQDVAVFTIQRFNNGEVYLQLTGDEALYGRDYIIEPAGQILLADWPAVRYILRSNYVTWQSDWYWGYYPEYWTPWRPFYWHYYYGYHYNWNNYYYSCYHRSYAHYDVHWHNYYYNNHRHYSNHVVININNGHYRTTYSHPEKMRDGEELYRNRYPEAGRRSASSNYTGSTRSGNNNVQATGRRSTNSEITTSSNNGTSSGNDRTEQRVLRDETSTRRMASEATRTTIGNSSAQRSNETERRPAAVTSSRSESRPEIRSEQYQNISSSRPASRPEQSPSVTSSRPASRPEQGQSIASQRPASRPEQSQSVSSSRPASRPEQSPSVTSSRPASRPEQSQSAASPRPASRPEQNQNVSQNRSSEKSRPESVSVERRSVENDRQVKSSHSNDKETKTGSTGAERRK